MFDTKEIIAFETAVVDLNYPKDGGSETLKQAFFSSLPRLIVETANNAQTDIRDEAPRKGDMVMISAEALDAACLKFAEETHAGHRLIESIPAAPHTDAQKAESVRRLLFGTPVLHAGGSLANTFDSLIYSRIDGKPLYQGNFLCTLGADAAGEYFKKSFEGHIRCAQGGRQMVSHIVPVDGDRIMITAPSFTDPSEKYFHKGLLDNDALKKADLIMIGGYLKYAGHLDKVMEFVNDDIYEKMPTFVFTLAAQKIAASCDPLVLRDTGNLAVHANTGEFRRNIKMDEAWRERFNSAFVDRDGNALQGHAQEVAKNANIDYINAKQAANEAASIAAYHEIVRDTHTDVSYVVTNGSRPARAITKDGITVLPNLPIEKSLIKSTVGAGDNHVAGYWTGKALGRDESGSLAMARAFARAVIQIPEARLPRDAEYKSVTGKFFQGPIAALDPSVLDKI